MKQSNLQSSNWDALISRYFDALTTPEEEAALRRFLASEEGKDPRYDEVRAVMGFIAVGRKVYQAENANKHESKVVLNNNEARKPRRHLDSTRLHRIMAVAAAAVVVIALGTTFIVHNLSSSEDVCVAYIGGKKVTDPDVVMMQMLQSLEAVSRPDEEPTIEQQLGDMFETLEQ